MTRAKKCYYPVSGAVGASRNLAQGNKLDCGCGACRKHTREWSYIEVQAIRNEQKRQPQKCGEYAPIGVSEAVTKKALGSNNLGCNIEAAPQQMLEHAVESQPQACELSTLT